MNELMHAVTEVSAGAAGALVAAAWEGTLLAGAVFVALRLIPRLSAAARSVIWLNVFILLALLHFVPAMARTAGATAAGHGVEIDARWSVALVALWAAASVARAAQFAAGAWHLWRLGRRAVRVEANEALRPLLATAAGGRVELCTSDEVARPSVLGFRRPRILLPPGLMEKLTAAELRQVVAHEMEHLRRGDDWTNLLQKLALVVFPLNPAMAWVERRLCAERELACDDRVLDLGPGRKAYALCLAHLAEYALARRGFSLVLGAWERRPELARRVHRILRTPGRGMGRKWAVAVSGGVVAAALGLALELARSPEVVSFVPGTQVAHEVIPADLGLGGRPQLVKAVIRQEQQAQPVRKAVVRRTARRAAPVERLAGLRMPAPPEVSTLLVMTEWSETDVPPALISTVVKVQADRAVVVPASYVVVRTPAGWLVIQI
jgi:beta-lactamase regulating signal transducer with metallopeptidase domain